MGITVIRIYDDFSAAQMARAELLSAGFGEASVHLTTKDDEAGPIQGNFVPPGKDHRRQRGKGFFGNLFSVRNESRGEASDEQHSHARQNHAREIVHRGIYLLTVDAGDDVQHERAASIMNRYGAFDIERRLANRPGAQ
jgi:hypothetical protein